MDPKVATITGEVGTTREESSSSETEESTRCRSTRRRRSAGKEAKPQGKGGSKERKRSTFTSFKKRKLKKSTTKTKRHSKEAALKSVAQSEIPNSEGQAPARDIGGASLKEQGDKNDPKEEKPKGYTSPFENIKETPQNCADVTKLGMRAPLTSTGGNTAGAPEEEVNLIVKSYEGCVKLSKKLKSYHGLRLAASALMLVGGIMILISGIGAMKKNSSTPDLTTEWTSWSECDDENMKYRSKADEEQKQLCDCPESCIDTETPQRLKFHVDPQTGTVAWPFESTRTFFIVETEVRTTPTPVTTKKALTKKKAEIKGTKGGSGTKPPPKKPTKEDKTKDNVAPVNQEKTKFNLENTSKKNETSTENVLMGD